MGCRSAQRAAFALFLVAGIACAHTGTTTGTHELSHDSKSVYVDPKILNSQSVLRLRSRSASPFRGTVEIPVRADGRAEIFGIKIFPLMDDLMRQDLQDWLQGVMFKPGTKDGIPVASVYKMAFH
jgi:hypothetical protein